jgi:8-oxo-dGTP pyrophosphatase MutT (NUDIX family)
MAGSTAGQKQRPTDAATLVLIRRGRLEPEVLMGLRHRDHVFMPNRYVFPGGRVDPGDSRIVPATPLRRDVEARLCRSCSPARARALAVAAIRETYEETGLMLGKRAPAGAPGSPRDPWPEFATRGLAPALDALDYVLRAVTPPRRPRRFNARFFVADAGDAVGEIRGSGELEDIGWVSIPRALDLPIPTITKTVLHLIARLAVDTSRSDPGRPVPLYRHRYGRYEFVEE